MEKLSSGEKAGIRLIADLFVINDLLKNVLTLHLTEEQQQQLKNYLFTSVPKVYLAQSNLDKQIKEVRKIWLEELIK